MPKELMRRLVGSWDGTCRTWFEPGTLADESRITGTIRPVLDGLFLRHEYEATSDVVSLEATLMEQEGAGEPWSS